MFIKRCQATNAIRSSVGKAPRISCRLKILYLYIKIKQPRYVYEPVPPVALAVTAPSLEVLASLPSTGQVVVVDVVVTCKTIDSIC